MEAVKEAIKSTNGAKPADDIMAQIAALLQSNGYEGLGVVAVGPRTGSPSNPVDFLPEGWRLQVVPVRTRE